MTSWHDRAVVTIDEIHKAMPDASLEDRLKAIDKAYPFGPRAQWPYKMWLKARKAYIARWSDKPAGPLFEDLPPSPLERARQKAIASLMASPDVVVTDVSAEFGPGVTAHLVEYKPK